MVSPMNQSQNFEPIIQESVQKTISKYYEGDHEEIEKSQHELKNFIKKIVNESGNASVIKIWETDSELPIEILMKWLKENLEVSKYEFNYKIEFERKGDAFINDKINTLFMKVATVHLNKGQSHST